MLGLLGTSFASGVEGIPFGHVVVLLLAFLSSALVGTLGFGMLLVGALAIGASTLVGSAVVGSAVGAFGFLGFLLVARRHSVLLASFLVLSCCVGGTVVGCTVLGCVSAGGASRMAFLWVLGSPGNLRGSSSSGWSLDRTLSFLASAAVGCRSEME